MVACYFAVFPLISNLFDMWFVMEYMVWFVALNVYISGSVNILFLPVVLLKPSPIGFVRVDQEFSCQSADHIYDSILKSSVISCRWCVVVCSLLINILLH